VTKLASLSIQCFRNLSDVALEFKPRANLFYGVNGSGKTAILEAVHALALGRSFRQSNPRNLIQHGHDQFLVRGMVQNESVSTPMAVQRDRSGGVQLRYNHESQRSFALLAGEMPLIVLDPDSLLLVSGDPEHRRRFLDATVFHVEHWFVETWRRYMRALKQRNAMLRHGILANDDGWCEELSVSGELLTVAREKVTADLNSALRFLLPRLSPSLAGLQVALRPGWGREDSLREALINGRDAALKLGYTPIGPQRADLKMTLDNRPAAEVLSRGQLKVAVAAFRLAQGSVINERSHRQPIFLVDDVVAELDAFHVQKVLAELAATEGQVMMTSVDPQALQQSWPTDFGLFHVEQGAVTTR
jgi:DNA replication and repair protein RecF